MTATAETIWSVPAYLPYLQPPLWNADFSPPEATKLLRQAQGRFERVRYVPTRWSATRSCGINPAHRTRHARAAQRPHDSPPPQRQGRVSSTKAIQVDVRNHSEWSTRATGAGRGCTGEHGEVLERLAGGRGLLRLASGLRRAVCIQAAACCDRGWDCRLGVGAVRGQPRGWCWECRSLRRSRATCV